MPMTIRKGILAGLLLMAMALLPVMGEGGGLGKAVARGAVRSAAKAFRKAPS